MLLSSPHLSYIPARIVSLVPSQTELLYDLGLDKQTVGITKFCIHPEQWFRSKTRVGGTKSIKPDVIRQLNPDLIIANKEENVKEQVELLSASYPVWVTDINDLAGALQMIRDIGAFTGTGSKAQAIATDIGNNFEQLHSLHNGNNVTRTCYLIWKSPYMSAGGDTFINDMLQRCGLHNVFARQQRYPEVTIEDIRAAECELVLLSSEPYPFKQQHIDELQQQLPGCRIILVDGEMFSWYGSRLINAAGYFNNLISDIQAGI